MAKLQGRKNAFSNQRIYVAAAFDQTGKMNGKNVSMGIANDIIPEGGAVTDPMLVYDHYEDKKTGEKKLTTTVGITADQWSAIEQNANKDGDNYVFVADLMKRTSGPGLIPKFDTIKGTDVAFNKEAHIANIDAAKAAKKEAFAKKEAEAAKEAESDELEM